MSPAGISGLVVAVGELAAVRAVTGAIAPPVRVVPQAGVGGLQVRVTPEARIEPRRVIDPEPVLSARAAVRAGAEDGVAVANRTGAPVEPEHFVRRDREGMELPPVHSYYTHPPAAMPAPIVKIMVRRVDTGNRAAILDLFC